jgi:hypothetical protein
MSEFSSAHSRPGDVAAADDANTSGHLVEKLAAGQRWLSASPN